MEEQTRFYKQILEEMEGTILKYKNKVLCSYVCFEYSCMPYLAIYLFYKCQNNETISDEKVMSTRLKKSNDQHNCEIIKYQEEVVTMIL